MKRARILRFSAFPLILIPVLVASADDEKKILDSLPVLKPTVGYFVRAFGVESKKGKKSVHEGIDIQAKPGTKIRASAGGEVVLIGNDSSWVTNSEYKDVIKVRHGNGIETIYGAVSEKSVKVGDKVERGHVLGKAGRKNLHYEVRVNGVPVDPLTYILED